MAWCDSTGWRNWEGWPGGSRRGKVAYKYTYLYLTLFNCLSKSSLFVFVSIKIIWKQINVKYFLKKKKIDISVFLFAAKQHCFALCCFFWSSKMCRGKMVFFKKWLLLSQSLVWDEHWKTLVVPHGYLQFYFEFEMMVNILVTKKLWKLCA